MAKHGLNDPINGIDLLVSISFANQASFGALIDHNSGENSMNLIERFTVDFTLASLATWSVTAVGMPYDKSGQVPLEIIRSGTQKMTMYKFFKAADCPAGCL